MLHGARDHAARETSKSTGCKELRVTEDVSLGSISVMLQVDVLEDTFAVIVDPELYGGIGLNAKQRCHGALLTVLKDVQYARVITHLVKSTRTPLLPYTFCTVEHPLIPVSGSSLESLTANVEYIPLHEWWDSTHYFDNIEWLAHQHL